MIPAQDVGSQLPDGSLNWWYPEKATVNANARAEQRLCDEMFAGDRPTASSKACSPALALVRGLHTLSVAPRFSSAKALGSIGSGATHLPFVQVACR